MFANLEVLPLLIANCGWLFVAAIAFIAIAMCLQLKNMGNIGDRLNSMMEGGSPFKGMMPVFLCGLIGVVSGILAFVGLIILLIEKYS